METISCKGLSFTYAGGGKPVLNDISLEVKKGEICLVIGTSGAGKTTLLKLLVPSIAPKGELSGTVNTEGLAGFVSQHAAESLITDRVYSNISFALTNMGCSEDETALRVADTAAYFRLSDKLNKPVSELSGGEQQRLNLAAVMAMQPEVLILDEPCASLDESESEQLINTIKRMNDDFSTTVIMSEYSEKAFDIADTVAVLSDGKLIIKDEKSSVIDFLLHGNSDLKGFVPVKYNNFTSVTYKNQPVPITFTDKALTVKGLTFAYNKGDFVLRDVNYSAYRGKINAIIGANGSGKTTLLKCISGVKKPLCGRIKSDGKISMLCQNVYDLFSKDTCEEEATFGELMSRLGIDDIAKQHPYDISGGQAQRLALCKVLQTGADIILLDEPVTGLDPVIKEKLGELLRELCLEGKTVVLVTHDLDFAGKYCDYCAFLSEGKIAAQGERFAFFSTLRFYTTSIARKTNSKAVSDEDFYER